MKTKILAASIMALMATSVFAENYSASADSAASSNTAGTQMNASSANSASTSSDNSFAGMDSDQNGSLSRSEYEAGFGSKSRMTGASATGYISPAHQLNETDGMLDEAGRNWNPASNTEKPYLSDAHAANQTDGMLRMTGSSASQPAAASTSTNATHNMSGDASSSGTQVDQQSAGSNAGTDDSAGVTSNNPLTEQHIP